MTGDSAVPEKGGGRARLRRQWRAETTWRRHEIAGRMKDLQQKLDVEKYKELLDRVEKLLDEQKLPLTVKRKIEASLTLERGKKELGEGEKDTEDVR